MGQVPPHRALLLARTELVLVLDGDMLAHAGLHRSLANNQQRCACLPPDDASETPFVQLLMKNLGKR